VCLSPPSKDVDLDFEEMRDVDVNVTPMLDLTHHLVKMFQAHGPVSSALGIGSPRGGGGSSGVKGRGGDAVGVGGGNPFLSLDSLAGLFGPNGVVWEDFSSSLDGALREAKVVSTTKQPCCGCARARTVENERVQSLFVVCMANSVQSCTCDYLTRVVWQVRLTADQRDALQRTTIDRTSMLENLMKKYKEDTGSDIPTSLLSNAELTNLVS
jgi:hypothetical protein